MADLGGIARETEKLLGRIKRLEIQLGTGTSRGDADIKDVDHGTYSWSGLGGVERGIEQGKLEAARQTAVQNIQEPYQRVAFVSDIQSGIPSASQARLSQTSSPQPSPLGQAVGTGLGAYAAFSGR